MKSGSITSKDIIGWIVAIVISLIGSLVPLLIFYLNYRIDKKKSKVKIKELEETKFSKANDIQTRNNSTKRNNNS